MESTYPLFFIVKSSKNFQRIFNFCNVIKTFSPYYTFSDKEIISTLSKAREILSKIEDVPFTNQAEEYITDFEDGIKDKDVKPKITDRIKQFCSKSKEYIGEHKLEVCQILKDAVEMYLALNPPS